jgi:dihydrofolate reductase
MRALVYYVAATLDGYIAHEDGSFGGFPWDDAFGAALLAAFPETFPAPMRGDGATRAGNKHFDAVLMGRKTYEVGLREGLTSPYSTLDQYVFSRTLQESPDAAVTLVAEDAAEVVRRLKQGPGKDIWLCGGADLASTLLEAGLLDRMIVKLNPVLFGAGIPLFAGAVPQTALALTGSTNYDSGHVILHYDIHK